MNKVFFIATMYSIGFAVNAQTNKHFVYQDSIQHYFAKTASIKTDSFTETLNTKTVKHKTKKSFIKKILASYQGLDLRNAWALLSPER